MGNSGSTIFPVYVLGKAYEEKQIGELQRHTESFFRFTYRRGFPELASSTLTSDGGWGCMLRSAQMLMGHTLTRHYLGTEWRMPANVQASRVRKSRIQALSENDIYCEIMRWFTDYPGWPHVYSLHHLVHCGTYRYGKPAGQWVGPSTAAHMLRDLARLHCALFGGTLEVLVTQGDCIYRSEAELVATRSAESRAEYVHSLRQQHHHQQQQQLLQQQEQQQQQEQEEEQQQQYRVDSVDVNANDPQRVFSGDWQNPVTAIPTSSINPVIPLHPLLVPLSSTNTSNVTQPAPVVNAATTVDEIDNDNVPKSEEKAEQKCAFFDPLLRPPPKTQTPWTSALMVLVPLMLGISTVNREYIEEVKEVLRHRHCVGIIGGSPNHAIYFVGYRGDLLLGLDPHTVFANPPVPPPRNSNGSYGGSSAAAPLAPAVPLNPVSTCSGTNRGVKREPTARLSESSDSDNRTHSTSRANSSTEGPHIHINNTHTNHSTQPSSTQHRPGLGLNTTYHTNTTNDSFFTMFGATFSSNQSTTSNNNTTAGTFPTAEYLHQVHVSEFVTLDIHRLDPSLAIGFYFPNRAEFDAFCEETKLSAARKLREGKHPLYTVQDLAPSFMYSGEGEEEERESFCSHSEEETGEEGVDDQDTTDYTQLIDSDRMEVDASGDTTLSAPAAVTNTNKGTRTEKKKKSDSKRRSSGMHGSSNRRRHSSRAHRSGAIPDPGLLPDDPDDEEYVLV